MKDRIEKTESKALAEAKRLLRNQNSVKRLHSLIVRSSTTRCCCGETSAVSISAKIKGEWKDQQVGVCEQCFND